MILEYKGHFFPSLRRDGGCLKGLKGYRSRLARRDLLPALGTEPSFSDSSNPTCLAM